MLASLAIRFVFLLVGMLCLAIGAVNAWSTKNFLDEAITTEGTVIALDRSLSNDDGDTLVRPVVAFTSEDGSPVEFTSSLGSSRPSQREGDTVTVLYRPDDPTDAEIRGFWTLWFGPVVLSGLGSVFCAIGVLVLVVLHREEPRGTQTSREVATTRRDPTHLREDGVPIRATVTGVVTSAASATEPWWKLVAEWTDPKPTARREFVSHRLPVDPRPQVADDEVLVFIDPDVDEHYLIDLSFLESEPTFPTTSIDDD